MESETDEEIENLLHQELSKIDNSELTDEIEAEDEIYANIELRQNSVKRSGLFNTVSWNDLIKSSTLAEGVDVREGDADLLNQKALTHNEQDESSRHNRNTINILAIAKPLHQDLQSVADHPTIDLEEQNLDYEPQSGIIKKSIIVAEASESIIQETFNMDPGNSDKINTKTNLKHDLKPTAYVEIPPAKESPSPVNSAAIEINNLHIIKEKLLFAEYQEKLAALENDIEKLAHSDIRAYNEAPQQIMPEHDDKAEEIDKIGQLESTLKILENNLTQFLQTKKVEQDECERQRIQLQSILSAQASAKQVIEEKSTALTHLLEKEKHLKSWLDNTGAAIFERELVRNLELLSISEILREEQCAFNQSLRETIKSNLAEKDRQQKSHKAVLIEKADAVLDVKQKSDELDELKSKVKIYENQIELLKDKKRNYLNRKAAIDRQNHEKDKAEVERRKAVKKRFSIINEIDLVDSSACEIDKVKATTDLNLSDNKISNLAAIKIKEADIIRVQSLCRRFLVRKKIKRMNEAALKIQLRWKSYSEFKLLKYLKVKKQKLNNLSSRIRNAAATKIQKFYLGYKLRSAGSGINTDQLNPKDWNYELDMADIVKDEQEITDWLDNNGYNKFVQSMVNILPFEITISEKDGLVQKYSPNVDSAVKDAKPKYPTTFPQILSAVRETRTDRYSVDPGLKRFESQNDRVFGKDLGHQTFPYLHKPISERKAATSPIPQLDKSLERLKSLLQGTRSLANEINSDYSISNYNELSSPNNYIIQSEISEANLFYNNEPDLDLPSVCSERNHAPGSGWDQFSRKTAKLVKDRSKRILTMPKRNVDMKGFLV